MAPADMCNAAGQMGFGSESFNNTFPDLTLLTMMMMSLSKHDSSPNCESNVENEYDYVIVGAGSAGSVVASRLSEVPCISVLLLEAGGEPPPLTEVPAFAAFFKKSYIDWQYKTVPQKYSAYSKKDRRVSWNAGKVLGGTSTINAMLCIRGNHQNYNDWEALGAKGWNYANVLPYFLKLEDNRNIYEVDPGYHSTGGPIAAEKPTYEAEIKQPLLEAAKQMGYDVVDSNGRRQTGIYDFQATTRHHKRDSSYRGYLSPDVRSRKNLKILTYAYATKILIRGKRAYGVEFDRFNETYQVRARREVIISSGTVRTPQILMLSGIGPKDQLEKFNIDVVSDLPVGKNLQDHVFGRLLFTLDDDSVTPFLEKIIDPINAKQYIETESGPYTSPFGVSLVAFLRGMNTTSKSPDFPRQELIMLESLDVSTKPSKINKGDPLKLVKPGYECSSSLLQPESRGEITLNSKDPYDMPNIDPNYYKEARDLENVVEGMKICYALSKHPAMRKLKPELVRWKIPVCERYFRRNITEYFSCLAKHDTRTFWHYTGTARMGHCRDPNSVVDPQLRVIGVRGLRVISAAIMPLVTSGNINVPTMMIAEKSSDMIKRIIRCPRTSRKQ